MKILNFKIELKVYLLSSDYQLQKTEKCKIREFLGFTNISP